MKRGLGLAAVLFVAASPAHATSVTQADADFAGALRGCWTRVSWPADIEAKRADPKYLVSGKMCVDGGVSGQLIFLNCSGVDLDCQQPVEKYEIRDGQFWRDHGDNISGGRVDKCDMAIADGYVLTLSNCQWVDADVGAEPIEDIRYERWVEP
jgi:hypothetical protein